MKSRMNRRMSRSRRQHNCAVDSDHLPYTACCPHAECIGVTSFIRRFIPLFSAILSSAGGHAQGIRRGRPQGAVRSAEISRRGDRGARCARRAGSTHAAHLLSKPIPSTYVRWPCPSSQGTPSVTVETTIQPPGGPPAYSTPTDRARRDLAALHVDILAQASYFHELLLEPWPSTWTPSHGATFLTSEATF